MATFVWGNSNPLWHGGYDLSGYYNRISMGGEFAEKDATVGGGALVETLVPGLEKSDFMHAGFFDAVATTLDGSDNALFARLGVSDVPVSFSPGTGAEGDVAFTMLGDLLKYEFGDKVGEVMPYTATGRSSSGRFVRGNILRSVTLVAASTVNGTAQVLGALTANQTMSAALHILSCTGTSPSVTVKVQSAAAGDASFTSPTDRITFTAGGTNSYQWGSVAGAITDTRWRVTTTATGTSPVIPIRVVVGIRG